MFTKQHYKAIAEIINKSSKLDGVNPSTIRDYLTQQFGDYFVKDNLMFNWNRWENACKGLPYKK